MNRLLTRRFASMALNAASHNTPGMKTGPATGQPPPVSSETTAALIGAQKTDALGQSQGGQDRGDKEAPQKFKSEKELEKDRKKAEKQKKFEEKQAKAAPASTASATSKGKEKKAKAEAAKEDSLPEYKEQTPFGEKKILHSLDDVFHKAYNPKVVESAWYAWWEKQGFFEPEFGPGGQTKTEGSFVIPEPPPNVTGSLHMGHALPNALQDTLIRWNRMRGLTTLWIPGCDHASISTQTVVEKMLWKREKKTRQELGRQRFLEIAQDWKEEYRQKINSAIRRMGGSLDWKREAFTMDENHRKATIEHFVRLYEDGTIYRANRLVNWCTQLNTGISNLEMDTIELEGRTLRDVPGYERKVEFGVMTHFNYQIEDSKETIEIATTRPETMLGDTGIAINAKDPRWQHLLGKKAKHPFLNRLLPIFNDAHVDVEKGTGAVKITPAHDPHDFEIGKRHDLEFINILNDDGTMNNTTGSYEGMRRFDARYKVIEDLKARGLYVKWENNQMKIPICQKSKDVIEPRMKPQWWMSMQDMANEGIKAVKDERIKIRPESAEKNYFRWMENMHDWCISRQLWWGHQIPAYFIKLVGQQGRQGDESNRDCWVAGRTREEAFEKAKAKFPSEEIELEQDPDVLDTWFTSGMWPFSTLGWPEKTKDMENFYPTSLLETGWDILFFWVARMIMLGLKLTGDVPFREVYCHTLVRDSEGRKMSKSLGNVIDPIDVMEGISLDSLHEKLLIGNLDPKELATATKFQQASFPKGVPECGADALRFSLINYTTGGEDINFDINQMHAYRKFCNKIYQATKYVLGKISSDFKPLPSASKSGQESLAELWILHKLNTAVADINAALTAREFSQATSISYQYWYTNLCDVYIENSKSIIQDGTKEEQRSAQQTLYTSLEGGLTMIHPFMPFLTEELWQRLPRRPGDSCPSVMKAAYPTYNKELDNPTSEEAYELIMEISKSIRSLAAQYEIKEGAQVYVQCLDGKTLETCKAQLPSIKSLGGKAMFGDTASATILSAKDAKPTGCVVQAIGTSAAVYLLVKGHVDIDAEIQKANTRMAKASDGVLKQRKIIDGAGWSKMRAEAQESEKKKLEDAQSEVGVLEGSIGQFERLKLE